MGCARGTPLSVAFRQRAARTPDTEADTWPRPRASRGSGAGMSREKKRPDARKRSVGALATRAALARYEPRRDTCTLGAWGISSIVLGLKIAREDAMSKEPGTRHRCQPRWVNATLLSAVWLGAC